MSYWDEIFFPTHKKNRKFANSNHMILDGAIALESCIARDVFTRQIDLPYQ